METPVKPANLSTTSVPQRPVLCWNADSDEGHVKTDVADAATFLKVTPEKILAAIERGDPVEGWFVDWAVTNPTR